MRQLHDRLYSWASIIDDGSLEQVGRLSRMPFVFPHVAVMPDVHVGKGSAVGTVIPTRGAIMPAAVGVDIGCGMLAIRTQFTSSEVMLTNDVARLRRDIEQAVPLSPGRYNGDYYSRRTIDRVTELQGLAARTHVLPDDYSVNWEMQLGSLGGGNHFIEVVVDERERVWVFLHSGSRGVGNKIANHFIGQAQSWCERWFIDLPDPDLAYLIEGTDDFGDYMDHLTWAQHFAWLNREEMADRVLECLGVHVGEEPVEQERVHCHHNYTARERHFGDEVWVTRKGAIRAGEGELGLIPGSMGTASHVVEGLGNPVSLNSAPHGAGRVRSRRKAKAELDYDSLREAMTGIEWSGAEAFLDEHPRAYKDIDQVMLDARGLVAIRNTFHQIVNVKGMK